MRTEEEEGENFAVNFVKKLKLKTEEEESVAMTFLTDLTPLTLYSKPIIDHLTKMARNKIGYAHVVVKVTEQHLMSVKAKRRLPVLYLIDSIIQNVKGVYVVLFQQHIVFDFCAVFEKVDAETRVKMLNLRHNWNEVFEPNKLQKIDDKIRLIEDGWTITKKSSSGFQDTCALPDSAQAVGTSNEPSSSVGTSEPVKPAVVKPNTCGFSFSSLENATEAQLGELLIKQTELIDSQKRAIDSEYRQAKSKLEEQDRKIKELQELVEQERKNSETMTRLKSVEGYVTICTHCGSHSSDLQVCVRCDEEILPNINLILDPQRKSNETVGCTIEQPQSEKSTKKAVGESSTKQVDSKSHGIEKAKARITRERKETSYRETKPTDSENEQLPDADPDADADSTVESDSDFGNSSGSEYGRMNGKEGAKRSSPVTGRHPGKRPFTSYPKKWGRNRGRPLKAPPKSSRNGKRGDFSEKACDSDQSDGAYPPPAKLAKRKPRASVSPNSAKKAGKGSDDESSAPLRRGGTQRTEIKYKVEDSDEESDDDICIIPCESFAKTPAATGSGCRREPKPAVLGSAIRKPTATATPTLKSIESDDSDFEEKCPARKKGVLDKLSKNQTESDSFYSLLDNTFKKNIEKKKNSMDKTDVEKSKNRNGDGEKEDEMVLVSSEDGSDGLSGEAKVFENRTTTDYSTIDFTSDKKTASGEAWNFKISSWSVGGIKSWMSKGGLEYLKRERPDIMCLQGVRCTEKFLPPEMKAIKGYPHSFWNYSSARPSHYGVAIFSKTEPKNVSYGFPIKDDDSEEDRMYKEMFNREGRLIVAEYADFILFNAYVPNGQTVLLSGRLGWDKVFREYIKVKDAVKPVIVVGDLNVAHHSIDLANPTKNMYVPGFTKKERESFTKLLEETQLFDSFRWLYPNQTGAYSCWGSLREARTKNMGVRRDYILLSKKLQGSLCENLMRPNVYGWDHCPIVLFARI